MNVPPLRLGKLEIGLPVVQAALNGYSDLPMRSVAREHGAPYALAEVVLDALVLLKGKLRRRILDVPAHDHPVGGQLMGSDPELLAAAAKEMVVAGYDVVDINFGCPVNKVLGRCRGGYLLTEPEQALAIVAAVIEAVGGAVPVTVKMRRGYDESAASEAAFFRILAGVYELGAAAVTVHARTVVQKYVGPSRWEFLAKVKREFAAQTVLGSGDVYLAEDAVRMLRETGVDGVSVARGAIGNPFFFAQVRALLAGEALRQPSLAEFGAALLRHWQLAVQAYGGESAAFGSMRAHAIEYTRWHPQAEWARDAMVAVRGWAEFEATVRQLFGGATAPVGDSLAPLTAASAGSPAPGGGR